MFTPSHLPILVTNHLPQVSGDSPAIWRRLRVVPFDILIPDDEQDAELGDTLQAEADAVLAWSLRGWIEYQNRRLDAPTAVVAATGSYQKDSDSVGQFIDEACHVTDQVKISAGDLFDAWERWRKLDDAHADQQEGARLGARSSRLHVGATRTANAGGTVCAYSKAKSSD